MVVSLGVSEAVGDADSVGVTTGGATAFTKVMVVVRFTDEPTPGVWSMIVQGVAVDSCVMTLIFLKPLAAARSLASCSLMPRMFGTMLLPTA